MSDIPNDDKPGFVAEKPEHCSACYRLIRPGQIYHLTIEFEVLCEDCALSEGVIRVRDDLAVEVRRALPFSTSRDTISVLTDKKKTSRL